MKAVERNHMSQCWTLICVRHRTRILATSRGLCYKMTSQNKWVIAGSSRSMICNKHSGYISNKSIEERMPILFTPQSTQSNRLEVVSLSSEWGIESNHILILFCINPIVYIYKTTHYYLLLGWTYLNPTKSTYKVRDAYLDWVNARLSTPPSYPSLNIWSATQVSWYWIAQQILNRLWYQLKIWIRSDSSLQNWLAR